jgi:hypothetical protein
MIQPTLITFEQGKKLKEKGFYVYGYLQDVWLGNSYKEKRGKTIEVPVFGLGATSKLPEQWMVVEWFRVEKGIWVVPDIKHTKGIGLHFGIDIWKLIPNVEVKYIPTSIPEDFLTPQEAYSAAFDYVLNNLI